MTERKERCETCRFWKDHSVTSDATCHRYPPAAAYRYTGDYRVITDHGVFPHAYENDWCGEYQPAAPSGDEPVSSLRLSVRARKVLEKAGVRTIAELIDTTPAEIMCWRNAGETTLDEIRAVLAERGLGLKERP